MPCLEYSHKPISCSISFSVYGHLLFLCCFYLLYSSHWFCFIYSSSHSQVKKDDSTHLLLFKLVFDKLRSCLYLNKKPLMSTESISFISFPVKYSANCLRCTSYCLIVLLDLFSTANVARKIFFNFSILSLYSANSVLSFRHCNSL